MKVTIQYKVNINDVESVFASLVKKLAEQLGFGKVNAHIIEGLLEGKQLTLAQQKIDNIRQELASIDEDFEEISLLIAQFQHSTAEMHIHKNMINDQDLSDHEDNQKAMHQQAKDLLEASKKLLKKEEKNE